MYTIGIRRGFGLGYKKFQVKGHRHEFDLKVMTPDGREVVKDVKPRLVLRMLDDSVVVIPRIEDREWKIYPNFFTREESWPESAQRNFTALPLT